MHFVTHYQMHGIRIYEANTQENMEKISFYSFVVKNGFEKA